MYMIRRTQLWPVLAHFNTSTQMPIHPSEYYHLAPAPGPGRSDNVTAQKKGGDMRFEHLWELVLTARGREK